MRWFARSGRAAELIGRWADEAQAGAFKLRTEADPESAKAPASRWPGVTRTRDAVDMRPAVRPSTQVSRGTVRAGSGRDNSVLARSSDRTRPKRASASGPAFVKQRFMSVGTRSHR